MLRIVTIPLSFLALLPFSPRSIFSARSLVPVGEKARPCLVLDLARYSPLADSSFEPKLDIHMTSQLRHALKRELTFVAPLVARQSDTSTSDICIQNCLYSAVPSAIGACNLSLPCMCGNSAFRANVHQCMASQCGFSGDTYDTAMDQILDQCVAGAYGGDLSGTDSSVEIPDVTTPARSTTRVTSHTSSSATSSSSSGDKGGVSTGLIAGAAIGAVLLLALIGCLIWFIVRRNKRKAQLNNAPHYFPQNGATTPGSESKIPPQQQSFHSPPYGDAQAQQQKPFSPPFVDAQGQQQFNSFGGQNQYAVTPDGELGYVPPSAFTQYGSLGGGAAAAGMGAAALGPHHSGDQRPLSHASNTTSSTAPMLTTTATAPQSGYGYATSNSGSAPHGYATSNSGSSDSGPGVGGFNPYVLQGQGQGQQQQQQQQRPLQLHSAAPDVYGTSGAGSSAKPDYAQQGGAAAGGQWMSAENEKKKLNVMSADQQGQQGQQEEAPPPVYR
ncbi:hypothetical protein BKA62DRAFT_720804, partial [Auriculariales sp. MPI-PUGE-AT-0066]